MTTLTAILTALQTLLDDPQMPPICLIVKLHPREAPDRLASVIRAWSHPKLRIMLNRETDPDEMIAVSDVVIGMFSMLLIEAFMACKPIVSAQLNLTGDDPFVLSRRGYVCAITSQEALLAELRGLLLNPPASLPALDWIRRRRKT